MRRNALIAAMTALVLASIGYQVCGTNGGELGKSEEGRKKFVEVQILLTKGEYEEAYTRAEKLIPEYAGDYQISLYVSFWARVFRWQDVDERRGATRPEPPGIGARIQKMKDKKDKDVLDLVKLASLEIEQSRPYLQELLRRFPDSVWKDWAEWMLCHTKFVELNEKYRDKNAQEGFRSVIRELYDWGKRYIEEHPGSYMLPCAFDAVSMWRGYLAEGEKADEEKKRADEEIIELSRRILRDYPDAEYYRAWARATLRRRLGGDAPEVRSYSEKEDRAVLKFYVHVWPEHEECVKEYLEIKQAGAPAVSAKPMP